MRYRRRGYRQSRKSNKRYNRKFRSRRRGGMRQVKRSPYKAIGVRL